MLEKDYIDKIQSFLENKNYKVYREVIPDECKNWEQPYRVDMIFYREDVGWYGVEGKVANTYRSGSKVYNAIQQIKKYRNLHYSGKIINNWCFLFGSNHYEEDMLKFEEQGIKIFLRYFLLKYKIFFMEYCEYKNKNYNHISICPYTKQSRRIE